MNIKRPVFTDMHKPHKEHYKKTIVRHIICKKYCWIHVRNIQ